MTKKTIAKRHEPETMPSSFSQEQRMLSRRAVCVALAVGGLSALVAAAIGAAIAIAAGFALQHGGPVLAPFGVGLAVFVMAGAVVDIAERTMVLRVRLGAAWPQVSILAGQGLDGIVSKAAPSRLRWTHLRGSRNRRAPFRARCLSASR